MDHEIVRDPTARLAAKLRHANVVDVMELGEDASIVYQVMTWVEGPSLGELLAGPPPHPLPPGIAARVMSDALAGLHAAHEVADENGTPMQLVHRDVSPQNILVGADGVSRLTDFGIAKALGSLSSATQIGHVRGKPGYFAPEQAGGNPLDRRCYVYAAGIVLWEALTGRRLYRATGSAAPIAKITDRTVPSPCDFEPSVPMDR